MMSASDTYHDYLIGLLQDPEEAAAYLEAILEEEDPDPELLMAWQRKGGR